MTIQLRSIFFTSLDCFRGNNICYSNFNPVQEYIWVGSAESTLPQTHVDLFGFARGSDFNKALNLLSLDAFTLHFEILKRLMEKE